MYLLSESIYEYNWIQSCFFSESDDLAFNVFFFHLWRSLIIAWDCWQFFLIITTPYLVSMWKFLIVNMKWENLMRYSVIICLMHINILLVTNDNDFNLGFILFKLILYIMVVYKSENIYWVSMATCCCDIADVSLKVCTGYISNFSFCHVCS